MALSDLTSDGTPSDLDSTDISSQDTSGQDKSDVPLKNTKFSDILVRRRNFAISNRLHNTGWDRHMFVAGTPCLFSYLS